MQDLKHRTDEELADEAQKGDNLATEELILRYNHAVRARARQFFLAGGETEDLVQGGMIGGYFAVRDYRGDSGKSFKNFAYMCVTRRIYDAIGKMTTKKSAVLTDSVSLFDQRVLDILDERASPEEHLIDSEARAEFQIKLMRELSDFEYRVLNMYLEGMSYSQICDATKKPFKSVDNALVRAKRKLQKAFEK
ncbi:MAG: sigma-70 family RNA polymerase sigma factor [Clostridia bacterium]|nr:sigma-70 family RNA polymerase sigma factor [Clostridia bacterium]